MLEKQKTHLLPAFYLTNEEPEEKKLRIELREAKIKKKGQKRKEGMEDRKVASNRAADPKGKEQGRINGYLSRVREAKDRKNNNNDNDNIDKKVWRDGWTDSTTNLQTDKAKCRVA